MKNLKKALTVLLCGFILLGMLSACGKESGEDKIVWYMRKPVADMSSYDVVMQEANKIIKKELGIELEMRFIESGMYVSLTKEEYSIKNYYIVQ